jgi:nucleoside-diphosphate-sugar epimerase
LGIIIEVLFMSILVIGGTGFIGSFLTRELLASTSEKLILFDFLINKERISDFSSNPRVTLIQGDVSKRTDIESILTDNETISLIYHFSSLMPPLTEMNLSDAFRINIKGTFNVLEAARSFEVPKVIYSSSGAVYGPGVDLPVTEKTYRDPWTMYGAGKVCSEVLGGYYRKRQGIDFTSIRFPALLGPGRTGKGMTMFANNIIQYPAQNEKAICNVEEDVTIPMMYIKDASRFLVDLSKRNDFSEQAYNIEGPWISAEELASLVKLEIPDANIEYQPDPALTFQLKSWEMMKGDDSLVQYDLGYSPKFSPEEFVNDFIREVRTNKHFQI